MVIRNPAVWGWESLSNAAAAARVAGEEDLARQQTGRPQVRQIGTADLVDALKRGWADFGATRADVVLLCVIYPLVGLLLARLAFGSGLFELVFPLIAGFALMGPVAGIGLNEMSRRREQGLDVAWFHVFDVVRPNTISPIIKASAALGALFVLWLVVATGLYKLAFMGAEPATIGQLLKECFTTLGGWFLIIVGNFVGLLFAVAALTISVVTFPLILDRHVSAEMAMETSIRAVRTNPRTMAIWGLIIAAGLVVGSIPVLIGLAIVLPVLGHATWHLYRRVVVS